MQPWWPSVQVWLKYISKSFTVTTTHLVLCFLPSLVKRISSWKPWNPKLWKEAMTMSFCRHSLWRSFQQQSFFFSGSVVYKATLKTIAGKRKISVWGDTIVSVFFRCLHSNLTPSHEKDSGQHLANHPVTRASGATARFGEFSKKPSSADQSRRHKSFRSKQINSCSWPHSGGRSGASWRAPGAGPIPSDCQRQPDHEEVYSE